VRKEALLKARGCGLTLDPRAIDTTRAADGWHWHDVRLAGRIAMSIATPYPRVRIVTMDGLR
jgi:phosphopantetheinyl transferase